MKIALLNDLHIGLKNGSPIFNKELKLFIDNIFIPYIDKENINAVIIAGDLFDNRRAVDVRSMNEIFIDTLYKPLNDRNVKLIISLGNHDLYYRNKLKPNSLEWLSYLDNVDVIDTPIAYEGIDIIPWICHENRDVCMEFVKASSSEYVIGHFDFPGFDLGGYITKHGEDKNLFKKYKMVLSGHYHKRMQSGNIYYLGTQYQMDRHDTGLIKGFHIFENGNLKFIPNPRQIFTRITVTDDIPDLAKYKDCYLTVVCENDRDDFYALLDSALKVSGVIDYKILTNDVKKESQELSEISLDDNKTFIDTFIDKIEFDESYDKDYIKILVNDIYSSSIGLNNEN